MGGHPPARERDRFIDFLLHTTETHRLLELTFVGGQPKCSVAIFPAPRIVDGVEADL
jgi:hypothetical protein